MERFWADERRRNGRWQTGNNYVPRHSFLRENSLKRGSTRRIRKDWKGQMGKDGRGGWLMGNIIPLDGNIVSAVRNK